MNRYSKYYQSEKGKQTRKQYWQSARGRSIRKAYRKSEAGKQTQKRYSNSEKGQLASKNAYLKYMYGISRKYKVQVYEEQKGLCALCLLPLPSVDASHYDHNHETGEGRGLLHGSCNLFIGYLEHNRLLLAPAIQYLHWEKE